MARFPATDPWSGARAITPASVSFTRQTPAGGPTLDALMRRQKELAARQEGLATQEYPGMGTIAGGIGNMINQFTTARAASRAEEQEAEGRAALADLLAKFDPTGENAQQIAAQASQYDPDLSIRLMEGAAQARATAAERAARIGERQEEREWQLLDAKTKRGEALSDFERQRKAELEDYAAKLSLERSLKPTETFATMTPEEEVAAGLDPAKTYQRSSTTQKISPIGGEGTTVNVGGGSKLGEEFSKTEAKTLGDYQAQATVSAGTMNDMQLLDELGKIAPQGPLIGNLAKAVPGISSAGAAFQSIVNRVAPTLRTPGSGATSDIEYEGMLKSLPGLQNQPEANRLISGMVKAKAQLNIERGDLVNQWRNGQIEEAEMRTKLGEINRKSIMSPELRALIEGVGMTGAAPSDGYKIRKLED